jgi:NADP-dependent 3-hydroxy acid dehydrogenase YdfG
MKNVYITGNTTEFEKELARIFEAEGYKVCSRDALISGEKPAPLDILIDTTDVRVGGDDFAVGEGVNFGVIEKAYRENVFSSMANLENYLPCLDEGEGKRICWLSGASASFNESRATTGFGYNMAKASLHQFIQLVRNKIGEKGYTFRVFDPLNGEVEPKKAAGAAFYYITRRRGTENHDPRRDDENNLTLYDALGRAHAW